MKYTNAVVEYAEEQQAHGTAAVVSRRLLTRPQVSQTPPEPSVARPAAPERVPYPYGGGTSRVPVQPREGCPTLPIVWEMVTSGRCALRGRVSTFLYESLPRRNA